MEVSSPKRSSSHSPSSISLFFFLDEYGLVGKIRGQRAVGFLANRQPTDGDAKGISRGRTLAEWRITRAGSIVVVKEWSGRVYVERQLYWIQGFRLRVIILSSSKKYAIYQASPGQYESAGSGIIRRRAWGEYVVWTMKVEVVHLFPRLL